MRCLALAAPLLALSCRAVAAPYTKHDNPSTSQFPSRWYHDDAHFAHALFARDTLAVGSPEWATTYPSSKPDAAAMPAAWAAALAAASIPAIPPSTTDAAGVTVYPDGLDPSSPKVCAAAHGCRAADDVWDAPDGVYALGFDGGPVPGPSDTLYQFLHNNSQHATHFMIGSNILGNQAQFKYVFETLQDDIAVHTYSHPMMTTLSNEDVVAELGYTIQIIRDLTGGLLPRFWRPPHGDVDARVRAIAREVFGLTTVLWNQDAALLHGPKAPGLIVCESELSAKSVQAFMDSYPTAIEQGWKVMPVTQLDTGMDVYRSGVVAAGAQSLSVMQASTSALPSTPAALVSSSSSATSGSAIPSSITSALEGTNHIAAAALMSSNHTLAPSTESAQTNGSRTMPIPYQSISPGAMLLVALPIAVAAQLLCS